MKNIITLLFITSFSFHPVLAKFQFISPLPGSKMINIDHNILIRDGNPIAGESLDKNLFSIVGSKSGFHDFTITLSVDGKTIILTPIPVFGFDEEITVTIKKGLERTGGIIINGDAFSFTTHREYTKEETERFKNATTILQDEELKRYQVDEDHGGNRGGGVKNKISGMFTITANDNPAPGDIFFDSFSGYYVPNDYTGYSAITSDGDSVFSRTMQYANDFKLEKSGYFGVYNGDLGRWDVLDSAFNVIDYYYPVNGYSADNHEFQMLLDGHVLVIALDFEIVDMTVYDPSYYNSTTVVGSVIQEFDENKNLVFEWRSFDHVDVTEALHEDLAQGYIDYMHTNALEIDNDGNILTSNRHLDQVNKIDRNTGEFIWRLGGVKNQFAFINEPEPFNYQHDIRRIANGNITLFDNGNWHSPAHSAAKEYQLDEVNKTATLVWKYSHLNTNGTEDLFYFAMGNVQRLSNGNTFINWGWRAGGSYPSMTEVTPDNTIAWELKLTSATNLVAYRAHKYQWEPCARPTFQYLKSSNVTTTSAKVRWQGVAGAIKYKLQYRPLGTTAWAELTIPAPHTSRQLGNLVPATTYEWRVETWCDADGNKSSGFTSSKKFKTAPLKQMLAGDISENDISIYPNPAHNTVTIDCGTMIVVQARLIDLSGRELMSVFPGGAENNSLQLPLVGVAAGNYFIELRSDDQKIIKKLLIE